MKKSFKKKYRQKKKFSGQVYCPECQIEMELVTSPFKHAGGLRKKFWACKMYPSCKVTHSAHPNGEPVGFPADEETRQWRGITHDEFDKLWKNPNRYGKRRTRVQAYGILVQLMGISRGECHIGNMTKEQCQEAVRKLKGFNAQNVSLKDCDINKQKKA